MKKSSKKFNAKNVAVFIYSQSYNVFEYEVRGKVMDKFGVTNITAAKWVERVISLGLIVRTGKVALCVV